MNVQMIPNILTSVRIILVPFFIWAFALGKVHLCTIIFAVSGASDVLDGIVARRFGAESNLGKILDPIADKLTYATTFFCLFCVGKIPFYFVVSYVVIQLMQGFGAIVFYKKDGVVVKSNIFGKIAGFSIFSLSFINLVFYNFEGLNTLTNILCIFVLVAIFAAGVAYFVAYSIKPEGKKKQL